MDITYSLINAVSKPTILCHQSHDSLQSVALSTEVPWSQSSLNPQNRINRLNIPTSNWRIDGANILGRQLHAVPLSLLPDLHPLAIFVYLPKDDGFPQHLRQPLRYARSVVARNGAEISKLTLSEHICNALDHHCRQHPNFLHEYRALPFGSELSFDKIAASPEQMTLRVAPAYELERQTKSIPALQKLWQTSVPETQWPERLDINHLRLKRILHDSVSLVSILAEGKSVETDYIFKSNVSDISHVYHELHFLLQCKPHARIIPKPLYIVTKKSSFGGKRGVYGFVLPYYPLGTLRDALPTKRLQCSLDTATQLRWTKQIVEALRHIQDSCGTFYSDLRPDNILLTKSATDESREDVVLIDFEQRGNWYEWCPPEIRYKMFREHLGVAGKNRFGARTSGLEAVKSFLDVFVESDQRNNRGITVAREESSTAQTIRNIPWLELDSTAREKAMVSSLGLLMWCIFESTCNPRVSITNAWPIDPHIEFPQFESTPPAVRDCIRWCTADAPEWKAADLPIGMGRITRRGERIVCISRELDGGNQSPTAEWKGILAAWEEELNSAKAFFQSKDWQSGRVGRDRPTLKELAERLEQIDKNSQS